MSKVLVIGGMGLVGQALLRAWQSRGAQVCSADFKTVPQPGARQLDMRDEKAVRALIAEFKPEMTAVPAANPFVDYCELHPEETRQVNVDGTLNVARACKDLGSRMVFFSSDYVFDGAKGAYYEDDAVNPLNEYGRQKAEAEAGVLAAGSKNIIVRTSTVYGWQSEPKNLVLQICSKLSAGEPMKIASGILCNPTYAENLAEVVTELAHCGLSGIFHVVGADRIERLDFARLAARTFGLNESLILPIPLSEFKSPTKRPKDSSLLTDKARAAVPTPLLGAREGLEQMLSRAKFVAPPNVPKP
jgi:dTDP-4-dehydrorhamnose reductase